MTRPHRPELLGSLPSSAEIFALGNRALGLTAYASARREGTYESAVKVQLRTARERFGADGVTHAAVTAYRLELLLLPTVGAAPTARRWCHGEYTADLSAQEKVMILGAAQHDGDRRVAEPLGVVPRTVSHTLWRAAHRLGTSGLSRTATVLAAIQHGQIPLEEVPWPGWMTGPQFPDTELGRYCARRDIVPCAGGDGD